MANDEDLPQTKAYARYEFDCPECSETSEADPRDSDPAGSEQTCESCGERVWISETV